MSKTVHNATVVVAGLGRLGTAFARHAVADGAAHVVVWDADRRALAHTEERLRAQAGETVLHVQHVDLGDAGAIAAAAQRVRHRIGRVDVVITDAMTGRRAMFWHNDAGEDIRRVIRVNALSAFFVTREFLPAMISGRRKDGAPRPARILTVVPAPGPAPRVRAAIATAAAAAVAAWSRSLRLELRRAGARHVGVTTVSAGLPRLAVDEAWQAMLDGRPGPYLAHTALFSGLRRAVQRLQKRPQAMHGRTPGERERPATAQAVGAPRVVPAGEAKAVPPVDPA